MLKPNELSQKLTNVAECFCFIRATLPKRSYHVAIYKYQKDYFVINDTQLFYQLKNSKRISWGSATHLLNLIEDALEENHYQVIGEKYIQLELSVLDKMALSKNPQIDFYEFYDD